MLESWLRTDVEGKMAAGIGPGGVAPREGAGAAEPGGSAPEAMWRLYYSTTRQLLKVHKLFVTVRPCAGPDRLQASPPIGAGACRARIAFMMVERDAVADC